MEFERFLEIEGGHMVTISRAAFHTFLTHFLMELSHRFQEKMPCSRKAYRFEPAENGITVCVLCILRPEYCCNEQHSWSTFTSQTPEILTGYGSRQLQGQTFWFEPRQREGVIGIATG